MTTNPLLYGQLVEDHQQDLMAAAAHARLRRDVRTAERRARRLSTWWRRRPTIPQTRPQAISAGAAR